MGGYQQVPRVHEPKDIRMWGCEDTNKHPEYMNLGIWRCEDAGIPTSIYKDNPNDKRMWG